MGLFLAIDQTHGVGGSKLLGGPGVASGLNLSIPATFPSANLLLTLLATLAAGLRPLRAGAGPGARGRAQRSPPRTPGWGTGPASGGCSPGGSSPTPAGRGLATPPTTAASSAFLSGFTASNFTCTLLSKGSLQIRNDGQCPSFGEGGVRRFPSLLKLIFFGHFLPFLATFGIFFLLF